MTDRGRYALAIVQEYLEKEGFDGLYNEECSCLLDDLAPCWDGMQQDCTAGYRAPCDCGEGCEYHIVRDRPKEGE